MSVNFGSSPPSPLGMTTFIAYRACSCILLSHPPWSFITCVPVHSSTTVFDFNCLNVLTSPYANEYNTYYLYTHHYRFHNIVSSMISLPQSKAFSFSDKGRRRNFAKEAEMKFSLAFIEGFLLCMLFHCFRFRAVW